MTKDYQEVERIAEGVAMRLDGRTVSGHEQFREMVKEEVVKALTTYGNAREQATVEEIVGVVEGKIKTICTKGGYSHEHEPFSCQPPKLCTYCQHKEDGLCEVDHGFSNYESVMYNQALTDLIEAIKK